MTQGENNYCMFTGMVNPACTPLLPSPYKTVDIYDHSFIVFIDLPFSCAMYCMVVRVHYFCHPENSFWILTILPADKLPGIDEMPKS